jgi:hypothetical protein
VLSLRKALYGLRQAPRAWNAKLDSMLKGIDFEQSPHKAAIYRRGSGGNALLVGAYVDDLVTIGTKDAEVAAFSDSMRQQGLLCEQGRKEPNHKPHRATNSYAGSSSQAIWQVTHPRHGRYLYL